MEIKDFLSLLANFRVTQLVKALVAPESKRIWVTGPMASVKMMTHIFPGELLVSARKL